MSLLDRLERIFGRFALPQVTIGLIVGQVVAYVAVVVKPEVHDRLVLVPDKVLQGEWWRLFSFLITPPGGLLLLVLFVWYLFYLMGTSLEEHWGTFRYNVYLLVGYLATVGVSFLVPDEAATNGYLMGSVFLAFAFLYPDFELRQRHRLQRDQIERQALLGRFRASSTPESAKAVSR